MNPDENPDSSKLSALLRTARVEVALPPRFQEGVWRRIAESEAPSPQTESTWLDALTGWLLRPRFAVASAMLFLLAGTALGVYDARQTAHQDAQSRYVLSVAPEILR